MTDYLALSRLSEEARYFADAVAGLSSGSPEVESLLDRYLDFRGTSAIAMRDITSAYLERESWELDRVTGKLEDLIRDRLAGVLPADAVVIKGYGRTHRKLYEYLWLHAEAPVSAPRLRALTGDQIHTERRIRELRDVGLRITATRTAGENVYVLSTEQPDVDVAVARLAPEFVKNVRHWSASRRQEALDAIAERTDTMSA